MEAYTGFTSRYVWQIIQRQEIMYLHEEYIARYNLDVPIIIFNHRSTVLLKSKTMPYKWRVLAFTWREPDRHPGFFELTYSEAVHNGYERGVLLMSVKPTESFNWDEYENAVLETVMRIKKTGFVGVKPEEQVLATWAIFLMMYDSWLAKNVNSSFFNLVELALSSEADLVSREKACLAAQKQLVIDSKVNDVWSYQLLPLARYGSEWLVKLIND